MWATIDTDALFATYLIESNAGNVINLELNPDSFAKLLKSVINTGQVIMKLTKRDRYPMLSFTTSYFGKQGGHNTVTHDLHVRVLSQHFISQITEPTIPDPDVVVMLPQLAQLSQISGSLKSLSDKLLISANLNGEFTIGISTPAVTTSTLFKGLVNPSLEVSEDPDEAQRQQERFNDRDKDEFCRMKVDAKDWCNLLRIGAVAKRVIACFCKDHALVLYVYISDNEDAQQPSVLTWYIATYQD